MERCDLHADPIEQFRRWWDRARAALDEPNAMVLATADATGRPTARHVLLKGLDERGFVWFTNYESAKARDLDVNPRAALVFPWFPIRLQVVVSGVVTKIDAAESDAYFATRDRASQLGAWASPQSSPIPDRAWLEARVAGVEARFAGSTVPRPPYWGGYRLAPDRFEFWHNQPSRLHDRFCYERIPSGWTIERLAP